MFRSLLLSLFSAATFLAAASQPPPLRRPLVFEPNRGQAPPQAKWIAKASNYQLFLTTDGLTILTREGGAQPSPNNLLSAGSKRSAVRMKLAGSQAWDQVTGLEPTGGVSNYFLGSDSTAWLRDVPHYSKMSVAGVYDGIDLVFYTNGASLEYDFVVAPGADPTQIQLAFDGTERMQIDEQSGDLVLTTATGAEVRHARPAVYQQIGQERVAIPGGYRLLGRGRAAFTLASYDRRQPLLIDPTVSFTTVLSGSSFDTAAATVVDSAGNSYVTGYTESTNFPVNDSSLQWDQPSTDAFVTKLSPQGAILFSTYLGGVNIDVGRGIAVDSTGVYVVGDTTSPNFPHQNSKRDNFQNIFVTKIFLDGNGISYTAIIGDSDKNDGGHAIAVVPATHEAYVTGFTNFPAFSPHPTKVRIAKLDASGAVARSIVMPGSGSDSGEAVAIDHAGDVWIAGVTCSKDFVVTIGSPFPAGQLCTGFAAKWDPALVSMRWSRFWGAGAGVTIDAANNAYITGAVTASFSAVAGAFQFVPPQSGSSFITKFNSAGSVVKSTYLGGNAGFSKGQAIALNSSGDVYVAGVTAAADFPGNPTILPNSTTGFLSKLSPDLDAFRYSKFLGIQMSAVAVLDQAPPFSVAQIYAAGDLQTIPGVASAQDAFVLRLDDNVDRYQVLWHNPLKGDVSTWLLDGHGGVSGIHSLFVPVRSVRRMLAGLESDSDSRSQSGRHWRRALVQRHQWRYTGLAPGSFRRSHLHPDAYQEVRSARRMLDPLEARRRRGLQSRRNRRPSLAQ